VNHWTKSIHFNTKNLSPKERAEVQAELQKKLNDPNLPSPARVAIEQALKETNPSPTPQGEHSPNPEASPSPANEDHGPIEFGSDEPHTDLGKWLEKRAREKIGEHGSKAELFFATLFQNLPYMMLCCVPLFALVLKVLYVRRKIFYIEHLIYALHIHSFAYVAVILLIY